MDSRSGDARSDPWPRLDTGGGDETRASLLLWTQLLGKTRMALSPLVNHWWNVALYLSARGLTTSPMPAGDRFFDLELDFVSHLLVARTSDGARETMELCDQSLNVF